MDSPGMSSEYLLPPKWDWKAFGSWFLIYFLILAYEKYYLKMATPGITLLLMPTHGALVIYGAWWVVKKLSYRYKDNRKLTTSIFGFILALIGVSQFLDFISANIIKVISATFMIPIPITGVPLNSATVILLLLGFFGVELLRLKKYALYLLIAFFLIILILDIRWLLINASSYNTNTVPMAFILLFVSIFLVFLLNLKGRLAR